MFEAKEDTNLEIYRNLANISFLAPNKLSQDVKTACERFSSYHKTCHLQRESVKSRFPPPFGLCLLQLKRTTAG